MTDAPRHAAPPTTVTPTFESVFMAEYPRIVALAVAVSARHGETEDIAGAAMQRLQRNWSRVRDHERPGVWVRRVTIDLALSRRRRLAAAVRASVRLRRSAGEDLPTGAAEHAPVWRALARLPGRQRAAVALHYLENRRIDEIADILDCSPATARVHLHRGRTALRDRLQSVDPTKVGR